MCKNLDERNNENTAVEIAPAEKNNIITPEKTPRLLKKEEKVDSKIARIEIYIDVWVRIKDNFFSMVSCLSSSLS